jgi:AraC family transcriptional regulator, glycine betaine-responsive activator
MNIALSVDGNLRSHPIRTIESVGFLLVNNFTLIAMAAAIESLRLANQLSGQQLYRWHTLTLDGRPVWASNGLQVSPDAAGAMSPAMDAVFVCGGKDIQRRCTVQQSAWLRSQAAQGVHLGGLCSGSWALAAAGLLDGYECSIDWAYWLGMQDDFPGVLVSPQLFVIDRNRYTASGGTASLEMTLRLIGDRNGHELVAQICEALAIENQCNEQSHQRLPIKHILGSSHPKLQEVVALMESNLREPLELDELAGYLSVSRRHLERLFLKYLHCAPSRYYQKLRLIRARKLLKQTLMSVKQVAQECGFVSTPHFNKRYREQYGRAPRAERARHASLWTNP